MGKLVKISTHRVLRAPRVYVCPPDLRGDRDLLIPAVLFWLASVVRVALGIAHHEVFQTEGTLALLCVALVPWLILGSMKRAALERDGNHPKLSAIQQPDDLAPVVQLRPAGTNTSSASSNLHSR